MSSFTYDGPRNVLCTPASMFTDVRIQPTPEPTPISVGTARRMTMRAEHAKWPPAEADGHLLNKSSDALVAIDVLSVDDDDLPPGHQLVAEDRPGYATTAWKTATSASRRRIRLPSSVSRVVSHCPDAIT